MVGAYTGSTGDGQPLPTDEVDAEAVNQKAQRVPHGTYMTTIKDLSEEVKARAVDAACEPGDIVLFSNILVHCGGSNATDRIRWSCDWRYQDAAKSTFREEQGHVVWDHQGKGAVRDAAEWAALKLS